MMRNGLVGLVVALLCGSAALAQEAGGSLLPSKPWAALSPEQQQVLQPLAPRWAEMDAAARDKWLALAAKYPSLGETEQGRMRSRIQSWAELSADARQHAREGFQTAQRKSDGERQAKWAAYQQLPPEKRLALQERGAQRQAEAAAQTRLKPVSPGVPVVAQVAPGVSTVLLSRQQALAPAPWVRPGSPPLRASWAQVDPVTLMPYATTRLARPAPTDTEQR